MKIIKLLFLFSIFLPLKAAAQGLDFTTSTTAVFCVNDGSITVRAYNQTGHVQYELVNYSGIRKRSLIGVPQDDPVFLNLAPGTYTVGVYDDNNATIPVTKEVIVPDYGSGRTLTINSIYSSQLAYCGTDTNPASLLRIVPDGGKAPYTITVLDTNDAVVREETSNGYYDFLGMPDGTYKIRVKDNCGTVVNSNSPHIIKPNIVYNFTLSTPMYWYWDSNVKVTHSGGGTICDPVSDAYYDFSYPGGIPVIKGNDESPISQAPGITRMYAVEYDGVKTPYMTYSELQAYKQPLPLDINTWKPMTLWVSICGVEKSTVYPFPSRKNEFLPKLISNAGVIFYVSDDAANTLCTPTGFVTLSRYSLLSGFCDPLTLTITEKYGAEPTKQYTITAATQNDFEAQLAIGNTYILKFTDANGNELNRFSYINVTRGQYINLNSKYEIFIDPVNFRPSNQDELAVELGSMADFRNFGRSQIGIKDYAIPKPYTAIITGPNGFYKEKTVTTSDSYVGTLLSNNLMLGDYTVRVTSAASCYDKTFPITLDRIIDGISLTTKIIPDPVACDRYIKTFDYKIINRGTLRPYPNNSFEDIFKAPQIGLKVIDGPAGYTQRNAIINGSYSWNMAIFPTATAAFRGDITGLYNISLVDYNDQTYEYMGPLKVDVKSEFPVFDMNGSGGAICTGSTTGTLSIVVKNATSPVYYLKKASDTNYPATGQSSPDFPNLTAGDYTVKVETACYPTALEASFKMDYISNIGSVIVGENNLCAGDALNLAIKSLGPIASAEWKLPDGTTQTGNSLVLSNPQSGQYSVIVTTRSGCMVTDAIEVKVKRRSVAADQRPLNPKTCNLGNEMLLSAFKYPNPTLGKIYNWYSAPELGAENLVYSGNSYYRFTPTEIKTYIFYVTVTDDEACENLPGTAAEVTLMVIPEPPVPNGDAVQSFCKETVPLVSDLVTDAVVDIAWYASPTLGDRPIPMNTPLVDGQLYYAGTLYGGEYSFGCEGKTRLEVTAKLNDRATAADITGLSQSICDGQGADMLVSSAVVNPIFTWYSDAALTNVIATGENYGVTPTETTSYYVTVKGDNACENLPGTAKEIIITVNPALVVTPPDPIITDNQSIVPDINFDSSAAGTLYVWSVDDSGIGLEDNWISSPNIRSFEAINTGTEPVTATVTVYPIGTFCGAGPFTFTITVNPDIVMNQPTDIKVCTQNTVSEITFDSSMTGTTYSWINNNPKIGLAANGTGNIVAFTAINNGDSTEIAAITVTPSANGRTGKPVVFTIEVNPQGAMNKIENQNICLGETALLSASSSTVNNPIFTWYSDVALTDVLAIDSNYSVSPLVTTIYYVTVKGDNACEGNMGMPVTVDVNEVLAPTGNTRQEFCLEQNALVSDLVTNENNVIWYDAANGGNIISNETVLINGSIYYGSLKVGTCESTTRLAVTTIINNAGTPTGNARQEFCLSENALVSDLVTNENNVIWYDAANGGNIIPNGTALINGSIYYGSLKVGTCENLLRLAVTAIIKADLPGETIGWNTTACVGDEVTYRTTALMSNYNWRVNGGTIKSGGQFNDDFVTVSWTTAGNGSIGVAFINASNCDPIVTIHFPVTITVCSDIAIGKRVNNPTPTIGEQVIFTVTATNIGTNDFQHVNIDEMLPSGYSYVIATTTSGTYNSTSGVWSLPVLTSGKQESLTLTAKVLEKGDYRNIAILSSSTPEDPNPDNNSAEATVVPTGIIIYNAVSANGDGLNDYFKIEGLHHYPDNTVEIYNRWGVKIFETNGYGSNDNVFRGISDGRTTVKKGEIVPEGTYFYMLRYKTNTGAGIEKSGYLYVN